MNDKRKQMTRLDLEKKIKKRIHAFDLISLVRALELAGYAFDDIQFQSHLSFTSQTALIEDIVFRREPIPKVVVVVNFGLLSVQSLLPSYFFKKMDSDHIDTQAFIDFIGFFDQQLIRDYLLNLYPEINPALFPNRDRTLQSYLKMLDLKSCSTLHFLFQLVFPELTVKAEKIALNRVLQTIFPRLGMMRLGDDAVFGREVSLLVSGIRVMLISEDEFSPAGEPWGKEIRSRLNEMIFPILRTVGIDLEILLVIRSQRSWAKLQADSYLGYDRIRGGKPQPRRIRIFRGYLTQSL